MKIFAHINPASQNIIHVMNGTEVQAEFRCNANEVQKLIFEACQMFEIEEILLLGNEKYTSQFKTEIDEQKVLRYGYDKTEVKLIPWHI